MNKLILSITLAAAISPMAGNAYAGFTDGNELYQRCGADSDFKEGFCLGYITGVSDVLPNACFPSGIKLQQVEDVVKAYLRDNPQDRHYDADSLIRVAIDKAFCPGGTS